MTSALNLRANVVAARGRLAEGRAKLKQRHLKGSPGIQVCGALSDLLDDVVRDLFAAALADLEGRGPAPLAEQVALVPLGGYGRRDVAPYSDVDLMILHAPEAEGAVAPLAERMVRDLFDAGLALGQSVRTPALACQLARGDAVIATSLIESRFLAGSESLYEKFSVRFAHRMHRRASAVVKAVERARAEERAQYGETVYLLEPNVKRSRGGLRDIQLLRWVGFARHGTSDPEGLRLRSAISPDDFSLLRRAWEFLLRLRNDMHFHAGKAADQLDRVEQLRLAESFGYAGEDGMLPVEEFMRDYFQLTTGVSDVTSRFVAAARGGSKWRGWLEPLFSHKFEGDFRVGPRWIVANRRGLAKVCANVCEVLRLADLANSCDKPIAPATREAIRTAAPAMPDDHPAETARRFLSLLGQPARLGELLRALHETGILERVVPAFARARSLLQFNEYHKYTVDEHCLRAVERAADFQNDPGELGYVYRGLKRKWLLHLALLIHDLGKGYAEDHSDVGLRIAHDVARRLELPETDAESLNFLVHKHLMMSHLAFRRDTSDQKLIVRFAVDVGSPEVLQMLFVLTAADLAAVGPGVLNAWKVEVLADLYHRTFDHLAGDASAEKPKERFARLRDSVLPFLAAADEGELAAFDKRLEALPASYLFRSQPDRIAEDLKLLRSLEPHGCLASGRYQPETNTVEYKIVTHDSITPGVFHKLTGALAAQGLLILSAQIHTLEGGVVFDRFQVADPDYAGEPPRSRIEGVSRVLTTALREGRPPAFRRVWKPGDARRTSALPPPPTQVRIDNSTSDRYTVVDVFAADRRGLLYTIARSLFEAGLSVSVAKIGTYLDQVVDVFYVSDERGRKVEDAARMRDVRAKLLSAIDELERTEA